VRLDPNDLREAGDADLVAAPHEAAQLPSVLWPGASLAAHPTMTAP